MKIVGENQFSGKTNFYTIVHRARELWISKFPSIVYFRNGEEAKYRGEITNPKAVYNWLTSEKTLNLPNRF